MRSSRCRSRARSRRAHDRCQRTADTPDTRADARAPAPQPIEEDEPVDALDAAFGGARQIDRGPPPVDDVASLNTNRGDGAELAAQKPVVDRRAESRPQRSLPCGSGKKYKKCHGVGLV